MDILQEHGYQSIAGTLCRKYRIRDDEVKQLIQNRDIAGIHARSKRLKQRIIDSVTEGFPKCAMRDRVTSRLSCDGYYIENVIIQSLRMCGYRSMCMLQRRDMDRFRQLLSRSVTG